SLVANYLFLLGSGRFLGTADYSTVAALLGLVTIVLLPTGALQMAVSREISRFEAVGERALAASFARALLRVALLLTAPLVLIAFALVAPLRELLNVSATAPVALAVTTVAVALIGPVAVGVLQGYGRFRELATVSAAPMVLRLGLLVVLFAAGFRLYGALICL